MQPFQGIRALRTIVSTPQCLELLSAFITVALFYLAFPSGGYGRIAWFAIVPIIVALNNTKDTRNAFMLGLLAATLGWMCSIWWATGGISKITNTSANFIVPIIFIFCLVSAIPYAIACWCHVKFNLGRSVAGAIISAAMFTSLVNFLPHILPGNLAHALYLAPFHIQTADIGGVAAVFFIVHCVNILLGNSIYLLNRNCLTSILCLSLAVVIFAANLAYGHYRISAITSSMEASDKRISLLLVQPNISIVKRTRDDWRKEQAELSTFLITLPSLENIDLVIFPELPVPISSSHYVDDKIFFDRFFGSNNLLLTAVKPVGAELSENAGYFNTIELHQEHTPQQHYAKQVLLPFGEYIPFSKGLPWLTELFGYAPNYLPGESDITMPLASDNGKFNLIPLICYEAVFSDLVNKAAKAGGEIMINTSNDAWFDAIEGKNTHFALSLFRAIEYRKPLIRVTNTGVSGIILPTGAVIASSLLPIDEKAAKLESATIIDEVTYFQEHPNAFKVLLIIFLIITLPLFTRKEKKREFNE